MTRPTRRMEYSLHKRGYRLVAGADEAGRGAWAGPLVAAAVILPDRFVCRGLNDSKLLSPARRELWYARIIGAAVSYAVTIVPSEEVDLIGLQAANLRALAESVKRLRPRPDYALVDGFRIQAVGVPMDRVIGGDRLVVSISAASVLAKVTRDRLMVAAHEQFPQYHFHRHKGYGTAEHRQQLQRHGLSPFHRRSFEPMKSFR